MQRAIALAVLLLSLVLVIGCGQEEPAPTSLLPPTTEPIPTKTLVPTIPPSPTPEPSPTLEPSPTPLPASFILEKMRDAYEGIESVRITATMTVTMKTPGMSIDMPVAFEITFAAPNRNRVTMSASFLGDRFEMEMITIGEDFYSRESPAMEWTYEYDNTADESFDHREFLVFELEKFKNLALIGTETLDGTELYHLRGTLPWEELGPLNLLFAGIIPIFTEPAPFEVNYWVGDVDFLLRTASLESTFTGVEDGDETTVGFNFILNYGDYNTPLEINPPPNDDIISGPGLAGDEISLDELSPETYGQIAFVSERSGNFDIYLMESDGSGITRLTSDGANDTNPVWSPDGLFLSFSSEREGTSGIYIMKADGSEQTSATSTNLDAYWSSWSPDGQQIIYDVVEWPDEGFAASIYALDLQTFIETQLTSGETQDFWPAWSPTGEKILFTSNRDGQSEIYIMNADGSDQLNLTFTAKMGWNNWLGKWSPDGSLVAFSARREAGDANIYVMNPDGTGLVQLTFHEADDFMPSWSPDGKFIAFTSMRDGDQDIYIMRADGSGLLQLTDDPGQDFLPAWRP